MGISRHLFSDYNNFTTRQIVTSKELDWIIGGAAFGFTAGLLQFLSSTALRMVNERRNHAKHGNSFLSEENHHEELFYDNDEDVYDYEEYALNTQVKYKETLLPKQFLSFDFQKIRQNVLDGQKSMENKITDYTNRGINRRTLKSKPELHTGTLVRSSEKKWVYETISNVLYNSHINMFKIYPE